MLGGQRPRALTWWARIVRVGGHWGDRMLLVTARKPFAPDDSALITHAAALLYLRCSADEHEKATIPIREAVLHLLMAGQVTAASQVAGAMKPALVNRVRVYVAEGTPACTQRYRRHVPDSVQWQCVDRRMPSSPA